MKVQIAGATMEDPSPLRNRVPHHDQVEASKLQIFIVKSKIPNLSIRTHSSADSPEQSGSTTYQQCVIQDYREK
jgi:hypothetical protein